MLLLLVARPSEPVSQRRLPATADLSSTTNAPTDYRKHRADEVPPCGPLPPAYPRRAVFLFSFEVSAVGCREEQTASLENANDPVRKLTLSYDPAEGLGSATGGPEVGLGMILLSGQRRRLGRSQDGGTRFAFPPSCAFDFPLI